MEIIRHHFSLIDSTNNWAKQHAHEFPQDKITLVTADAQSGGRGRFNRRWESPPGENIYATFCFFIERQRADMGNIPQVMALAAAKTLRTLGFKPTLKWPNDVLLSEKKIVGILAETTLIEDKLCMVVGIGLNVNMPEITLEKIDRPATSLLVEGGHTFDVEVVLKMLEEIIAVDLETFLKEGFQPFLESYRQQIQFMKTIRFHDNLKVWEGTLHAINPDGSLNLKLVNGEFKTFVAGEILWPHEKG